METQILVTISVEELEILVRKCVREELNAYQGKISSETEPNKPEYLSKKEAAKILRVTPNTLDLWVKRGLVKRYTISSRIRFIASEIRAFADTPNGRRFSTKR